MTLTQLSYPVMCEIRSGSLWDIDEFVNKAVGSAVMLFFHKSFYYSYPEWNTTWADGTTDGCFHRIWTKCHVCGEMPERNDGGYGSIWIRNDYMRFTCLCDEHAKGYPRFDPNGIFKVEQKQLTLFDL